MTLAKTRAPWSQPIAYRTRIACWALILSTPVRLVSALAPAARFSCNCTGWALVSASSDGRKRLCGERQLSSSASLSHRPWQNWDQSRLDLIIFSTFYSWLGDYHRHSRLLSRSSPGTTCFCFYLCQYHHSFQDQDSQRTSPRSVWFVNHDAWCSFWPCRPIHQIVSYQLRPSLFLSTRLASDL